MSRFATATLVRAAVYFAAAGWIIWEPAPATAQTPPPETVEQLPTAPPDSADTDQGAGWSFGGRGTLSWMLAENLETGLGFSGFAILSLSTDFEIEGEIGYQSMSTATTAGIAAPTRRVLPGLPAGRLSTFPLRASLRVQLWRFGGAKPYLNLGGGLYINRFTLDPAVENDLAELDLAAAATVDPGFGLHAGGGVEWQRGNAHFGFDVKYVFGETDVATIVVDQISGQVSRETSILDLDGFWIAAGLRYAF